MIQQIYTSGSKMVEGVRNLVIRTKVSINFVILLSNGSFRIYLLHE